MSRRRRFGFGRIALWLLLTLLAVFVLPVLALRWLPAPTSAFMLASDTSPVRYQWVSAAKIPASARRAVVASEDQKFFEHQGFGGAKRFAQQGFHRTIPFGVVADKCRRVCPWVNEHARA